MPNIHEFRVPIPIIVKETKEEGYAIYVQSGGTFENDIWTIALCNNGNIRHYRSDQIAMYFNATFDIQKIHDKK